MRFATAACAVLVLAAVALDSEAGRGGGGRGGSSGGKGGAHHGGVHHAGGMHHHLHHGGTHVFIGAGFAAWPAYYYYGPAYYYPPAYYSPVPAVPAPQYWYYCAPLAAYYPYVANCPVAWELVIPTLPQPY